MSTPTHPHTASHPRRSADSPTASTRGYSTQVGGVGSASRFTLQTYLASSGFRGGPWRYCTAHPTMRETTSVMHHNLHHMLLFLFTNKLNIYYSDCKNVFCHQNAVRVLTRSRNVGDVRQCRHLAISRKTQHVCCNVCLVGLLE